MPLLPLRINVHIFLSNVILSKYEKMGSRVSLSRHNTGVTSSAHPGLAEKGAKTVVAVFFVCSLPLSIADKL